ncbi:MAG: pentapeptide repeat-containing protein, partial [Dolichospermum sp.]
NSKLVQANLTRINLINADLQ